MAIDLGIPTIYLPFVDIPHQVTREQRQVFGEEAVIAEPGTKWQWTIPTQERDPQNEPKGFWVSTCDP